MFFKHAHTLRLILTDVYVILTLHRLNALALATLSDTELLWQWVTCWIWILLLNASASAFIEEIKVTSGPEFKSANLLKCWKTALVGNIETKDDFLKQTATFFVVAIYYW